MKILLTTIILSTFVLTGYSQDTTKTKQNKPKSSYQVGAAKVTVWENKNKDGKTWKNFKVEKVYKKGNEWRTTDSFTDNELLELKAVIDKAISEESVKIK